MICFSSAVHGNARLQNKLESSDSNQSEATLDQGSSSKNSVPKWEWWTKTGSGITAKPSLSHSPD